MAGTIKEKFTRWRLSANKRKAEKKIKKYEEWKIKCQDIEDEQLELKTEYGREKAWQERYIKSKAYIAIVIGIFMLLLSFSLTYICETSQWDEKWTALCEAGITILNSVFSIIIGIGISTLVLDFFGYIKYTRERLKEIMIDKRYIETLSEDEKKNIIDICERSLYFKNGSYYENSLFSNIKELIIPLIEENYYKQYKVHIDCYIDEETGVIWKKIHKIMDIECVNENTKFKIPFSTYLTAGDVIQRDNMYKLNECLLDGKDITNDVKKSIQCKESDDCEETENVKFTVDYEFDLKKGLNRIELRTETRVEIEDNTYTHTITIPCKRYSANFSLHNNNYEVWGFAFAFDDEKHKKDLDKVIYRDKYDDCYKIRFENWTLPGDGVVFVMNKKSDKKDK